MLDRLVRETAECVELRIVDEGRRMDILTASLATSANQKTVRRIVRLQALTIAWMAIRLTGGLVAAWTASSPALPGFAGDSAAELLSGIVVYWRFRSRPEYTPSEAPAEHVAGGLLFIVAAFVIVGDLDWWLKWRDRQRSYFT
jgi:hypothetical protein